MKKTTLNTQLFFLLLALFLTSFNCSAASSVWKKSYQFEASGQYKDAASLMQPLAQTDNELALLRYAYLQYMQGNYGESINYYSDAIKLNPESIDAKLGICLPLMAQKRWRQVKSYTHQVLKQSHWNYTAHVRLMIAEEGMGKWQSLATHAMQLSKVYPADATALVYLARAYAWQGKTSAAKSAYSKVLNLIPAHIEATAYINKHN